MASAQTSDSRTQPAGASAEDFSLVLGGPLYQLMLRAGIVRPPLGLLHRRLLVLLALAWLPLLALSVAEGHAAGGVQRSFLFDIETCARFLVAMPLLVLAEVNVHRRLLSAVQQLRERDLIAPPARSAFEETIADVVRLRNSMFIEIGILLLVYLCGPWLLLRNMVNLPGDSWYASIQDGAVRLTWAGWWLVYVSVPLFQFLLLRWYYRLLLWWWFLWRVSRLQLDVIPGHPDRAGGLAFLGNSATSFVLLLLAQGSLASGIIANHALIGVRSITEVWGEIGIFIALLVAVTIAPLLFFTPALNAARRAGLRKFGALGATYMREFQHKWLEGTIPEEPLLGATDIQTLADLASSSDMVRDMKPVLVNRRLLIQLTAAAAAPFIPLVLMVIPLRELGTRVLKLLL